MLRLISICLILITSFSYGQELVEKSTKYTGSKKTLAKYHVLKKKKKIKQGAYEVYNLDGTLNHTGWFNNNNKDSIWCFYGPGEEILIKGWYQDNLKNGEWKYYWDNGSVECIGYFKYGKESGHWKYFNEEGILIGEGEFIDGNEIAISFKYYDLEGNTQKKIETITDARPPSLPMTINDINLLGYRIPVQVYFRFGDDALRSYLHMNMGYLFEHPGWNVSGKVRVMFIVKPNGKIEIINIVDGFSEHNDQIIKRKLKKMPRWRPTTIDGLPVNTAYIYQYEYIFGNIYF